MLRYGLKIKTDLVMGTEDQLGWLVHCIPAQEDAFSNLQVPKRNNK
jgi:hypothetical protein